MIFSVLNKSNKKILTIGLVLMIGSLFLPYIVLYFLNNIIYFEIYWKNQDEFGMILHHLKKVGFFSGFFVSISSALYRLQSFRFFYYSLLPNVLLIISCIVFTLVGVEIVLFFVYKDTPVGGIRSPSHYTFYKKYYKYNKLGFRDRERKYENKDNTYRILVLGDSYTFGAGVKFKEDLYTYRLEESLNEKLSEKSRSFEVINTGLKGLSTRQEFEYLKEKGILFNPDFIILGFVLNDAETPEAKKGNVGSYGKFQMLPYPYSKFANTYSFTYFLVRTHIIGLIEHIKYPNGRRNPFFEKIYDRENLLIYEKILDEFMVYCKKRKIPVLVTLFPRMNRVRDEVYPYLDIHKIVKGMVDKHAMMFIDLLEPLRQSKIETFTVSKTDYHPNKEVHHLAAEMIYDKIIENLRPDSVP